MFNVPTVFILGAGASWHYGYPTGEGLVTLVAEKARDLARFFQQSAACTSPYLPGYVTRTVRGADRLSSEDHRRLWHNAQVEAEQLAERLSKVNPTVIDYFLAQNDDLHAIGKLAIAMVLFSCESAYRSAGGNPNRRAILTKAVEQGAVPTMGHCNVSSFKDDWLRFVLYKLTSGCKVPADLLENQVSFITFNYDTSLEHRLFHGLRAIKFFEGVDINEFLGSGRIRHVYGKLRERIDDGAPLISTDLPGIQPHSHSEMEEARQRLNVLFVASSAIHTIDGEDKGWNAELLKAARDAISGAHVVYMLGYGFDSKNSERIGLDALRNNPAHSRTILFTNFGGHNRVAKAASRIMFGHSDNFIAPNSPIISDGGFVAGNWRNLIHEMSVKNVYDAFEQDFESLETE